MNGVRFPPWRQSERGFRLSALASLIVKREIRMFNLSQSKAPVGTPFFLLSLSLCSQSSSAVSGVSDVLAKLLSHWSPTPGMPTERRKQKATSQRKYVTKSLNTAYYSKAFQHDNHNYMQYAISINCLQSDNVDMWPIFFGDQNIYEGCQYNAFIWFSLLQEK